MKKVSIFGPEIVFILYLLYIYHIFANVRQFWQMFT